MQSIVFGVLASNEASFGSSVRNSISSSTAISDSFLAPTKYEARDGHRDGAIPASRDELSGSVDLTRIANPVCSYDSHHSMRAG